MLPAGILTSYPHHDDAVRRVPTSPAGSPETGFGVGGLPGPFSKSARRGAPTSVHCQRFPTQGILATDDGHPPRSGAPPVISVNVKRQTRVILPPLKWPTRPLLEKREKGRTPSYFGPCQTRLYFPVKVADPPVILILTCGRSATRPSRLTSWCLTCRPIRENSVILSF